MAEKKNRINQIAKETGFTNEDLVAKAKELKMDVKSHSSSITEKEEIKLVKAMDIMKNASKKPITKNSKIEILLIDDSNISIGGEFNFERGEKFDYAKFSQIMLNDYKNAEKILVTSTTSNETESSFKNFFEQKGFKVIVKHREKGKPEKEVDTTLIQRAVNAMNENNEVGKLIIMSGDRDVLGLLYDDTEKKGWKLEIWTWKNSIARVLKESYSDKIKYLDDYRQEFIYKNAKREAEHNASAEIEATDRFDLKTHAIIHGASVAAGATGASPFPFSDTYLLVPVQLSMMTGLYAHYGVNFADGAMKSLVKQLGVSAFGKNVAGNLIKLIPLYGSIAGGVVNGATAVAITEALGWMTVAELEKGNDILGDTKGFINLVMAHLGDFIKK